MGPPDRDTRDEAWFDRLYTNFYPLIHRYGVRRLPHADAATELAQDVFVITWRRRAEVPGEALPWLYGVARRVLANRVRAEARLPLPFADLPETAVAEGPAGTLDLRAALARLSEVLAFERLGPVPDAPGHTGLAEYRLFLGATGVEEIGRLPR